MMTRKRKRTLQKLKQLRAEIAEYKALFDLGWEADMRGIKRWQAATGKKRTWPDGANLVVWLLKRLDQAEAVIDAARPLGGEIISESLTTRDRIGLDIALHIAAYDEAGKVKP